jgi:hypothetical protein
MMAFIKMEKPKKNQDPWPAITFLSYKALWRDSVVLFRATDAKFDKKRPKILNWLSDLVKEGHLTKTKTLYLNAFGINTDRAIINFWKFEQMPLPLEYLSNNQNIIDLRESLQWSEYIGDSINKAFYQLASELKPSKSKNEDIRDLAESFSTLNYYWAILEIGFYEFFVKLPEDRDKAMEKWWNEIYKSACTSFDLAAESLDGSVRTLKAVTKARNGLYKDLKRKNPIKKEVNNNVE